MAATRTHRRMSSIPSRCIFFCLLNLIVINYLRKKTFVEEPVDSVYGLALVVSSEQEEVIGVFHFISKKQANALDVVLTTVDIVAKE